jgi:hypothetical protein
MIIINILSLPFRFRPLVSYDRDPYACIRLLALDGRNAELAGGFPSNPILSGPRRTTVV